MRARTSSYASCSAALPLPESIHEREDRRLPIARRVDPAAAVEHRCLAAQDEHVGELIGRAVVERLVPACRAEERRRMHEEDVDLRGRLAILHVAARHDVRGVFAIRQRRPALRLRVVRRGRRRRFREADLGLEPAERDHHADLIAIQERSRAERNGEHGDADQDLLHATSAAATASRPSCRSRSAPHPAARSGPRPAPSRSSDPSPPTATCR